MLWWSDALFKKVKKIIKVEVNNKTYHVTYGVLYNFNLEDHNITPNKDLLI